MSKSDLTPGQKQAVWQRRRQRKTLRTHRINVARLTLHYPQYTYDEALDLPLAQLELLLKVVELERLTTFTTLAQALPASQGGKAAKQVFENFKKALGELENSI